MQFQPAWRMSVHTGQAGGLRFLHQKGVLKGGRPPAMRSAASFLVEESQLLRFAPSVHSCATRAKIVFFLKTKVLCPAAASGGFARPKNWSRSEVGQKTYFLKVLRLGLPIVENLNGPQESIFNLSRGPQLHFSEKLTNWSNFIKMIDFPPFPLFGVPWACLLYTSPSPRDRG